MTLARRPMLTSVQRLTGSSVRVSRERSWGGARHIAFVITFLITLLAVATAIQADTIEVGAISFDTLIPGSIDAPGVDDFSIFNLTGDFSVPPDFPVTDPLVFENSALVITEVGGLQQTFNLGDLGPGAYSPDSVQFSSAIGFTSAIFTATLNSTTFGLWDSSIFGASSSELQVVLSPSSGDTLSADVDSAFITVTNTPEPKTVSLVWIGLGLTVAIGRRHLGR